MVEVEPGGHGEVVEEATGGVVGMDEEEGLTRQCHRKFHTILPLHLNPVPTHALTTCGKITSLLKVHIAVTVTCIQIHYHMS